MDQKYLEHFIEELHGFAARGFPVREVRQYLKGNLLPLNELQPYVFVAVEQYTRNLIYKSSEFELMVVVWSAGQAAPIHGHEGEKCWARVESGELLFTNYREHSAGDSFRLETISQQFGGPGYLDGPADIHKVENTSTQPAITLHLYSRPFEACDIYGIENHRKLRKRLGYFSKFGQRVPDGEAFSGNAIPTMSNEDAI